MASAHFTARTGQISRGTERKTSPEPVRTAASAARAGAPVYPTDPARIRTRPKRPLCASGSRTGSAALTKARSTVMLMRVPSSLVVSVKRIVRSQTYIIVISRLLFKFFYGRISKKTQKGKIAGPCWPREDRSPAVSRSVSSRLFALESR